MTARKPAPKSSKASTARAVKSATHSVQKPAATERSSAKRDAAVKKSNAKSQTVGKSAEKKALGSKKTEKQAGEDSTRPAKKKTATAAANRSSSKPAVRSSKSNAQSKPSKDNNESAAKKKGKENNNDKAAASSTKSRKGSGANKTETIAKATTKSKAKTNTPTPDDEKKAKAKRKKTYEHAYEDPDWLGNEDDTGSVASGVMEEDFCFECGVSTLAQKDDWNNVVLCDRCDAEYHLRCTGLDRIPRRAFICNRCVEEEKAFQNLSFDVGSQFKLPKKKKTENKVVYSPSRPLQMAWPECESKGLMVVSRVFPYEVMRTLTHGVVEHHTKSGRIVDLWQGAVREVPQRLSSHACHNVVDRQGRFDLKLPDFLVEKLELPKLLEPILSRLRTIMGTPAPQIRTHNVVFAPVGSSAQEWHADDSMKKHKIHRYFTVLIQLNPLDTDSGGTEVWEAKSKTSDLIRCRPGDALVFNGSLLHRGQANTGSTHRFFYYASFACGTDMNVGMMM